jgi:hypothetical protein
VGEIVQVQRGPATRREPFVHLQWSKRFGDDWHELDFVDLSKVDYYGVYVIWKRGEAFLRPSQVLRIGQGDIAKALAAHRNNPAIARHGPGLLVTWAEVAAFYAGGVEVYLAQQLRPLLGERFSLATPFPVNLPISA